MKTTIYPDQSLLPKVYLTWTTEKDGRVWLDCKTGNKMNKPKEWMENMRYFRLNYRSEKDPEICLSSGSAIRYAYCKYHSETKLLEFAVVEMNSNRTGGARQWEYAKDGERYFLDKDKTIYTADGKIFKSYFQAYKNHSAYDFIYYLRILCRCHYNGFFMDEFKKFVGNNMVIVNNGRHLSLEYPYHIELWYKYKASNKTTGKVQKVIDEITALPHSDISNICEKFEPVPYTSKSSTWHQVSISDVIYFEKLNDMWSVLRYCYRAGDHGGFETYRVYISEDDDCKITKINEKSEWVPARNLTDGWSQSYGRIVNFDDVSKSKRLSYIVPILKEIEEARRLQYIVSIVKFPEIEKLYKMGYTKLATQLLEGNTVQANIKHRFGEPNKKAKTIFSQLGLNKHQLDAYAHGCEIPYDRYANSPNGHDYTEGIVTIKHYFGDDISAMDNDTFDKLLLCAALLRKHFWRGAISAIDSLNVDGKKFLKNIARLAAKHDTVVQIYNDAINTYHQIDIMRRPAIDWMLESYSDVVRVHDALIEILAVQNAERRARYDMSAAERLKKEDEDRKKTDEKRKVFEYEDDAYIIRLPKDNNEIVTEGLKQHICIGGYTGRHSRGETNLFFLRKKATSDQPFYAIEMDRNCRIVQIHGFGNKWLGNDPEAIPTVVRWLRRHSIQCDQKILTCKAIGYGHRNDYVEMPVVD